VGKHDKLLPGWDPSWVLIGDVIGGDPIIAAPKEPGTPIYVASVLTVFRLPGALARGGPREALLRSR
jgi:hypothetical protein